MTQLKIKFKTVHSFSTLFIFLFFFFIFVLPNDAADGFLSLAEETPYMLKLMNALTPTPLNWSNKTHICNWTGVVCGADTLRTVTIVDLSAMSLTGILPSGLNDSLPFLTKLDLSNNSLFGPLPSLANLEKLQEVHLHENNFTSIPDGCFQGLIGLQTLSLSNNVNLAPWEFPIDLTPTPTLKVLNLKATNLMGSLPDIFSSFPNLLVVYLFNNNLSGVLPKSFARSKIRFLYLEDQISYNKMSGTIEVLSSMTNLVSATLQGNRFEGPIPDLSNCTELAYLSLHDNQLTGVVPPSLMNLSNLLYVSLDHNFLQGPAPVPVLKGVTNVSLGDNTSNGFCLDHVGTCDQRVTTLLEIAAAFGYPLVLARSWRGNNPCKGWSFVKCDGGKIRTVNLTKLNLTGTMSPAFGNLTDLQCLYLGGNSLRGSIPESLATLPQLELVDVSNSNISGNIPKFSPKVRFIATGNVFLQYSQVGGATPSKTPLSRPWVAGTLGVGVGVGVIVLFVVIIYSHKKCLSTVQNMMIKKTRTCIDQNVEDFIKSNGFLAPKRYSYTEVKKMTNSFRNKLGQGGYGTVFKATLIDGREVAVKVLSESDGRGEEFINEVASISRTSHVNIVSLLGFCYEMNRRALIYEFMSNGSLDKFICGKGAPINSICDLNWNTLYKIAIGIARGLEYLHQGCNTRILHLDIKPQNILLDEELCPKIDDLGLAKICKKKESVVSILGIRGTPGYIAPEVYSRTYGGVSHKSDVYSYGMLMLEVVGARKNYDSGGSNTSEMYFPDWIYNDLEEGNIPTRYLVNSEEENEIVMKITLVSLWCIQPRPLERPSMSKVIEMLEGPIHSVPYPPKPILCSPERPSSNIHETNSMTT